MNINLFHFRAVSLTRDDFVPQGTWTIPGAFIACDNRNEGATSLQWWGLVNTAKYVANVQDTSHNTELFGLKCQ